MYKIYLFTVHHTWWSKATGRVQRECRHAGARRNLGRWIQPLGLLQQRAAHLAVWTDTCRRASSAAHAAGRGSVQSAVDAVSCRLARRDPSSACHAACHSLQLRSPSEFLFTARLHRRHLEEPNVKHFCHWQNKKDGYRQLNVRQLGSLRPWDHRGTCYMDRKRIQCLSNDSQHVPIYLQPFLRYSGISVASDWFSTVQMSEWAFLTTFCFSLGKPLGQSR